MLQTAGDRTGSNTRYVDQIDEGAPADLEVLTFSWWRALFGSYDVLHVHWPESLLRHGLPVAQRIKRLLTRLVLARLALHRVPLVRTVHNEGPHEPGDRAEHALLEDIDRRTGLWIVLNGSTRTPRGAWRVEIPHGHFRGRFDVDPTWQAVRGRLLQFGRIRPYKGIDRLLEVFRAIPDGEVSLRVVGKPLDQGIADTVRSAAARDARITHRLEFVDDDDLVREVSESELVVLAYTVFHNSGAALLALSLDRPVLLPRSGSSEALAAEAGPGWVHLFDPPLTVNDVRRALESSRAPGRSERPDLRSRDWDHVGRLHRDAYRAVLRRYP
ncbi:glycosyl transferase [Georgenia alba]|uniref:Glycosyl transferase n=1 Tax=Georgenia alba TaxID=2233858 RepID=A0ABW2Q9K7_9MICO